MSRNYDLPNANTKIAHQHQFGLTNPGESRSIGVAKRQNLTSCPRILRGQGYREGMNQMRSSTKRVNAARENGSEGGFERASRYDPEILSEWASRIIAPTGTLWNSYSCSPCQCASRSIRTGAAEE